MNRECYGPENAGNMPNGLHREKFGQGLPPVQVIFKKNGEIRQRQDLKNQKNRRKRQFSQQVFALESSQAPLYTLQEVLNNNSFRTHAALSNPC